MMYLLANYRLLWVKQRINASGRIVESIWDRSAFEIIPIKPLINVVITESPKFRE